MRPSQHNQYPAPSGPPYRPVDPHGTRGWTNIRGRFAMVMFSGVGLLQCLTTMGLALLIHLGDHRAQWSLSTVPWEFVVPFGIAIVGFGVIIASSFRRPFPWRPAVWAGATVAISLLIGGIVVWANPDNARANPEPWIFFAVAAVPLLTVLTALRRMRPTDEEAALIQPMRPSTRRNLVFVATGMGLVAFVVAVGVIASALLPTELPTPPAHAGVGATATVASNESPWLGKIPEPCQVLPPAVMKSVGINPRTTWQGSPGAFVASVDARWCSYEATERRLLAGEEALWSVGIQFSTIPYDDPYRAAHHGHRTLIDINGQPASSFSKTKLVSCSVLLGTVFGSADIKVQRYGTEPLSVEEACGHAKVITEAIQPYIPTELPPG